ncbi:MAG: hypothetical protein PCFJNLEI_01547 [Verrucomicrobiae bacterium]|nr:hypothetical protein [Verrucomicrobiae bacterium]
MVPDQPEVWVQGKVSGQSSVVSASVNGGTAIEMNRRGEVFGYLLPLEPGTNMIVVTASDANTNNPSSKVVVVERTDNAKQAKGTAGELGLAGVSVNGIVVASVIGPATLTGC